MKFLSAIISTISGSKIVKANIGLLAKYLLVILALITAYSIVFHYLMTLEGQQHSWMTGFYWTLVVMSTLGFGDITFVSDIGRAFSVLVLLSGVILLLILLPFVFIKFFSPPGWRRRREAGLRGSFRRIPATT